MARIVGVHRVGHQFGGESIVRAEWLPAIKDGLARVDRRLATDQDVECAFYGDLFRPNGKSGAEPPLDASDVTADDERELLELWWRQAAEIDPAVRAPEANTKVRTPGFVQRALNSLSNSTFFAGASERALIFDLKQTNMYFNDPEIRRTACARVKKAIRVDTNILIGHSLGSIVGYEVLCANPELPVENFVTIGSPLGISNLIFDKLVPGPKDNIGQWPRGVARWTNVADVGDIVASVKALSSRFSSRVTDHLTYNGSSAHSASRYLSSKEVGHAVADGL